MRAVDRPTRHNLYFCVECAKAHDERAKTAVKGEKR